MNLNEKEVILGLDISTACIGCCIVAYEGNSLKLLELTHVVPKVSKKDKTIKSLFLKNDIFKNDFLIKYKEYGITKVIIEEPLLNSNNVYTVSTLLRFNGMISKSVYDVLGITPEFISSYDARLYSFQDLMDIRKYGKNGEQYEKSKILNAIKNNKFSLFGNYPFDCKKKEILQAKVAEMFPNIEWVYDKKGELKKENFDGSDAFVCCLGYINHALYGDLDFKVTNHECKDNIINYTVEYWGKTENRKIILEQ